MNPAKREEIYKRLARAIPEPKSELEHATPFAGLSGFTSR